MSKEKLQSLAKDYSLLQFECDLVRATMQALQSFTPAEIRSVFFKCTKIVSENE